VSLLQYIITEINRLVRVDDLKTLMGPEEIEQKQIMSRHNVSVLLPSRKHLSFLRITVSAWGGSVAPDRQGAPGTFHRAE
jgi:hypothetical protein